MVLYGATVEYRNESQNKEMSDQSIIRGIQKWVTKQRNESLNEILYTTQLTNLSNLTNIEY